jgi:predicted signal transduction protein with EAL and GGDEF domain
MVLREVAERMKAGLRGNDQIARIGGDEFAAVLPETRLMEGLAVAERIRLALSSLELAIGDKRVRVTASLGVAKLTKDSAFVIDELVALTDAALARSKRRGKNRVSYAQDVEEGPPEDTEVFDAAVEMLRRGDGMRVVKQPILRLEDRLVTGYEMLSRGPEGFFENLADFFRIAY